MEPCEGGETVDGAPDVVDDEAVPEEALGVVAEVVRVPPVVRLGDRCAPGEFLGLFQDLGAVAVEFRATRYELLGAGVHHVLGAADQSRDLVVAGDLGSGERRLRDGDVMHQSLVLRDLVRVVGPVLVERPVIGLQPRHECGRLAL